VINDHIHIDLRFESKVIEFEAFIEKVRNEEGKLCEVIKRKGLLRLKKSDLEEKRGSLNV